MKRANRTLVIDGKEHMISIPPGDDDWNRIDRYLENLSAFNHELLKAVVALEKKVHWGIPTSPRLKKHACDCQKADQPDDYDPLTDDEGDDPDIGGSGSGPGDWGG